MGLSTYLRASNYLFEGLDTVSTTYNDVADALEDIVPLDIGVRHNSNRNIEISIPLATWHKGFAIDNFLWMQAGSPELDEFELHLDREDIIYLIQRAREIATKAEDFRESESETADWVQIQFNRLERALTDFLLDDRLRGWTLKVWRSY